MLDYYIKKGIKNAQQHQGIARMDSRSDGYQMILVYRLVIGLRITMAQIGSGKSSNDNSTGMIPAHKGYVH
jgi:hypothetical protein